ncbi:hypothetical protein CYLTODRAFT_453166 [Cylindrobasidium torrendii FP15055 ss-10]|uniref:Uncharacterized protein n=1 Tax=Cylindrobasidium torrendii FP15055 ss-10 TaxID=1314674 RepID=A0A0D7BE50_9AGAR|nr:hypothetical protein CYLTODRAFT_453166 [Cylindrobasidium torrendii FP15055 ss-10]
MAGISGDHAATGIPYSVRMQRTYELSAKLQAYGLSFESLNRDLTLPIGPNSIPPTLKASYELAPYETAPVFTNPDYREDSKVLRNNVIPKSIFGERCCVTMNEEYCEVGHWVGIGEPVPGVLHRVDRLAGTAPGTTNTNHRDNLCLKDSTFHRVWTSGNALVLAVTSSTDFRPPKRLRYITKHNFRCSPRDRINIYDWIPHTESSTSPGYLYLVISFNRPKRFIPIWRDDGHNYEVPTEDGVLTLMNNHPLLVSFASARVRQKHQDAKTWNSILAQQTPVIRSALEAFDELVLGWTTANIIETRTEFTASLKGPRTIYAPPPKRKPTRKGDGDDVPVRRNTRSNAAQDAKAAAEFQEYMARPRITRSQSTPNLNQTAAAQAPVLKRKKSVKKILKRAVEDEDDGGNAAASTSQAATRPVAKKTRK